MSAFASLISSLIALLDAGGLQDPTLRLPVAAQVPESCAVLSVDQTHWEAGRLRVHTQCNVQRYNLRLFAAEQLIAPESARLVQGEGEIEVRFGRVYVTQDQPGGHVIDLVLAEHDFDTRILRFRLEAG
jgi:hypothetical protein